MTGKTTPGEPSIAFSPLSAPTLADCPNALQKGTHVMKFGSKKSTYSKAHAGVSAHVKPDEYLIAAAPPPDRTSAQGRHYFLSAPSTCALAEMRALGDCEDGLEDIELHESYVEHHIGEAVTIVENVYARRGALERFTGYGGVGGVTLPTKPFEAGDTPIIDGPPYGIHVIGCTEDVTVSADGLTWTGTTRQGGQGDGGIMAFNSSWHVKKDVHGQDRLFAGDGLRYVVAVGRVGMLGRDTDDVPDHARDTDVAPPMPTSGNGAEDE